MTFFKLFLKDAETFKLGLCITVGFVHFLIRSNLKGRLIYDSVQYVGCHIEKTRKNKDVRKTHIALSWFKRSRKKVPITYKAGHSTAWRGKRVGQELKREGWNHRTEPITQCREPDLILTSKSGNLNVPIWQLTRILISWEMEQVHILKCHTILWIRNANRQLSVPFTRDFRTLKK